jgi:hypothetical protein
LRAARFAGTVLATNLERDAVHEFIENLSMIPAIFAYFWACDRFQLERPAKRIVIGCAGLCVSVMGFVIMNSTALRSAWDGHTLLNEIAVQALLSILFTGVFFSVTQILGGAVQGFKRWRYYRRNPQIHR